MTGSTLHLVSQILRGLALVLWCCAILVTLRLCEKRFGIYARTRRIFGESYTYLRGRIRTTKEKGWAKYTPIWFAAACAGALGYAALRTPPSMLYECPSYCFGVVKVEGNNAFEFQNIATGERSEWRFCGERERLPFYSGYVLSKLAVFVGGNCQVLQDGVPFKIVRGKDHDWKSVYGHLTYDDGPDRPVLARNCRNNADDSDTICDGGEAKFTQETAYAQPAR